MNKRFFRAAGGALAAGGLLLAAVSASFAGTEEQVNKEVKEQAAAKEPFPVHFSLTAGVDSEFIFRGVNILPEQRLDLQKASDIAINNIPDFKNFLLQRGLTADAFVKQLNFPRNERVARESGIGYFDAAVSAYGFTAGAFYALQDIPRTSPANLGGQSFFTEYTETDLFLTYSHSLGPVSLTLGGTYYHVSKNSQFDTAELNFGVLYTPPQFRYVSISFSYDYSGGFNYNPEYLDGHHLELRVSGDVPVFRKSVTFNPYILVSAGAGIVPRAFNRLSLPTYFSNKLYAAALQPAYESLFNSIVNGTNGSVSQSTLANARAAIDPAALDRSFDLSNAQIGFKVPVYLTRYVTLTGNFNYSRPLGNLQGDPYNQKDNIWGGASLNIAY